MNHFLSSFLGNIRKKILPILKKTGRTFRIIPSNVPGMEYQARVGVDIYYLSEVSFGGMNVVNHDVRFSDGIELGYATTVGEGCRIVGPVVVGNYCQIGPCVCLQAADHDYELLTPYNHTNLFGGILKEYIKRQIISVGHGVWIGYGAIVLKGVKIGNGSIIGAGSVVTKDIPAYQIAVGNPAHVIRQRFDDQTCDYIEQSKWWEFPFSELEPYETMFRKNANSQRDVFLSLLKDFTVNKKKIQ